MQLICGNRPPSLDELEVYVGRLKLIFDDLDDLSEVAFGNSEKSQILKSVNANFAKFYELPCLDHEFFLASLPEIGNQLPDILASENRFDAGERLFETEKPAWLTNDPSDEKSADFFAYSITAIMNAKAIRIYGASMNYMVQVVREEEGDWIRALADAVRIDPFVLSCPTITNRVGLARMTGDNSIPNAVMNALRSPKSEGSDKFGLLRFLLQLLDDTGQLAKMSEEEKYQSLCVRLDLYPCDGKDPARSLSKFIRRWKRYPGT